MAVGDQHVGEFQLDPDTWWEQYSAGKLTTPGRATIRATQRTPKEQPQAAAPAPARSPEEVWLRVQWSKALDDAHQGRGNLHPFLASVASQVVEDGRQMTPRQQAAVGKFMARAQQPTTAPVAAPAAQTAPATQPAPGTYTVVLGSDGDYVTLRLRDASDWAGEGTLKIEYLVGPDNSTDFVAFGFVKAGRLQVWKRYRDGHARQQQAAQVLLGADADQQAQAGMAYALASSRCCRCGRKLTVPASLHRGMGPECASK